MSWELISSIMIITLRADYLTATRLSPLRGSPAAEFSFARGSTWGPLDGPLAP